MTSSASPHEKRPWAPAIDYWLREKKFTQADLVRQINKRIDEINEANAAQADAAPEVDGRKSIKPKKLPRFGTNTMSRIARGNHTHTRKLEIIALHLEVPFEDVLVSPLRRSINEQSLQRVRETVREGLEDMWRSIDVGGGIRLDEATITLAKRLQGLSDDLRASALDVIASYEKIDKKRRRGGGGKSLRKGPPKTA